VNIADLRLEKILLADIYQVTDVDLVCERNITGWWLKNKKKS
jgi:hypothetical protein